MAKITLYIDCVSPYAFFAMHVLETYRHIWTGVEVEYVPIILGIVMKDAGNRPPIAVPNKGKWMATDIQRTVEDLGLGQFKQPSAFPYNSMKAQIALLAVKNGESETDYINCARALWRAGWTEHKDMLSPDTWSEAFSTVISVEKAKKYAGLSGDQALKTEVIANTKKMLANGAFGLPWFDVEKDGKVTHFFGNDRFHHIADLLGVEWKGYKVCREVPNAKL